MISGGTIDRKLNCSARFGPSSNQLNLPSIARSLPSDNENKHDQTAAILRDTFDRQDTLLYSLLEWITVYNLTEPVELVSNNVYMIQLHCMHYIDTLFQDAIDA